MASNIEVNRYIQTYVEYLLNRLYDIVTDEDKEKIVGLMNDNNYKKSQMGRMILDRYPKVDFDVYKNLELLRKLYEVYLKDSTIETKINYGNFKISRINQDTYLFEHLEDNIEIAGIYSKEDSFASIKKE